MFNGHCYETANEYIIRKLIKFAKQSEIPYSVYGFYVVTSRKLNFDMFSFKVGNYYLKYIGSISVPRWLYNDYKSEIQFKREIFQYCFRLKKNKNGYFLYIKNKKYKLYNSIHLMTYFYHKTEKEFFEKEYNLVRFNDNIETRKQFDEPLTFFGIESKYDKYGEEDYISSYDRQQLNHIFNNKNDFNSNNFNFKAFYDNYFIALTENQQKIIALLLLGIRITDISRLLQTTQVYCTLELRRIGTKIKKLYGKKQISIYLKDGD